jgi:hypothetical protein
MRKRDLIVLLCPMLPFIAAVFAADSSIDFRKLGKSHYNQSRQQRYEEFEQKARSGELEMTVDLVVDHERRHLNSLRLMDEALLDISGIFRRLALLVSFGIVAQVYVILRFKATRMKGSVEQVHEHTA